ncbi:MAG TPA: phage major capsid protein [Bacteroides sp.]|nr:phage major capsid protein [Bacteroides sp.]
MNIKELTEAKGKLLKEIKEAVKVDLKDYDQGKIDRLMDAVEQKNSQIKVINQENEKLSKSLGGTPDLRIHGSKEVLKGGNASDLEQFASDIIKNEFGINVQNRDVLESSGSGQYIVPAPMKSSFISYIIERSLLGRLGVPSVGVDTDTTTYPAITAIPTGDIIAEGAELTETDPTFVPRTMQTYSFRAGTIVSQEFLEDAISSPKIILEPIFQTISQHIDNMYVNGSGSGEMYGINDIPGQVVRAHMGANGAAVTGFEELGLLWRKLREANQDVTAFVMAPRTLNEYRLLEDAYEAPKANPYGDIPMVESNQVSITQTQGTNDAASSVYAGDFKRGTVAGWRYGGSHIKFLVDRSTLAEFGKVRLYGVVRMGLMYPYGGGSMALLKGVIRPAGDLT